VPKELRHESEDGTDASGDASSQQEAERVELKAERSPSAVEGLRTDKLVSPKQPKSLPGHDERKADNREKNGESASQVQDTEILCVRVSRSGQVFATITQHTLTVWQTWVSSGS
jgi:hypothetical protein